MVSKIIKVVFWLSVLLFVFSVLVLLSEYAIESFTYSDFFVKHFKLNLDVFKYISAISSILAIVLKKWVQINTKIATIIKKIFVINFIILIILFLSSILLNLIEALNYNNYVFSKIHLQPKLFNKTVLTATFLLIVNFFLFPKQLKIKGNITYLKLGGLNIKLPNITFVQTKYILLLIYFISLSGYVLISSVGFVYNFYKVDLQYRQQNEFKYFTQNMDIYGWVKEYLPETEGIINWCDQQKTPVDLVTFDPQMIWMSYEALSRVFLTNCRYANIDPVSKSYDYFKADKLLLVSVSRCDPQMIDTNPDPVKNVVEYFKIVNNRYICNSQEIIPNLYMWKRSK